ncbi:uncharacterized protein [Nicotiana sylvestris]|uniref:uncharacterized protein n=1 Tax=Nicotiana sylvestris TaxID=4096 RepID=UPI00388C52E5
MEDLNVRKEITTSESIDGHCIWVPNENVSQLEQKLLKFQEELDQDLLIRNLAEELKKLTSRIQGVEGSKGLEGLNYEDLCIKPDVELPEGYKPLKFEMFDGTGDLRVHLRTYCDKLVGVGKDKRIRMKLFMRSLKRDALSWYISQDPKKWSSWVGMDSNFMDKFRFNTENAPDVFYIQNLKKKPTETFHEYATRWRSETAKGHTIDECCSLKDKIQSLIDNKVIVAKEAAPNVHNNPSPDHKCEGVHMIEIEDDWDPEGSIGLVAEGDDPKKPTVTLNSIMVQIQSSEVTEVDVSIPIEFEAVPSTKTPASFEVLILPPNEHVPFEVKVGAPIPVVMTTVPSFHTKAIPWDYTAEARRKGKVRFEETTAAQGSDDLWRKIHSKEYSVIDQLNKTPAQISILSLLKNSKTHKNALLKVLSEAYVPNNITGGEMANMVGQVLESHKITFYEDELLPEGLGHNKALHITVQYEDYFITRILIDGGSSLNICPLITRKKLGKGLHKIKEGAITIKAFDGSQRSTIGEINMCLQMGLTWLEVDFQVIDVPASNNLLLGRPWIHSAGAVALTIHQAMKFEWNHQEVIIHGDGSNPIYSRQTIPTIGGSIKLGGEM